MTETRPTDEIKRDLATEEGRGSAKRLSPTGRLVGDVEPLLAERDAAVARAEQAEAKTARMIDAAADMAQRIPSPFADNVVNAVRRAALADPAPSNAGEATP